MKPKVEYVRPEWRAEGSRVYFGDSPKDVGSKENARLIAAAPEMLEMLKGVLDAAKSKNHTWLVDIAPSFIEGLLAKIEGPGGQP